MNAISLFFSKVFSTLVLLDTWELQDFNAKYMLQQLRFIWSLSVVKNDKQNYNKDIGV